MGQLSFFSADARPRALSDLEGLLCGRGQVVMFGRGTTARLSVVLGVPPPAEDPEHPGGAPEDPADPPEGPADPPEGGDVAAGRADDGRPPVDAAPDPADLEFLDLDPDELAALLAPRAHRGRVEHAGPVADGGPVAAPAPCAPPDPGAEWRARALCCAFRTRGADAEVARAPDGRPLVRSAFRADLVELARRWTRGAVKAVPPELDLDGPRLRLWVLAAGRPAGRAYLLDLDPHAAHTHEPLLTASRRAGLGATLGGDRAGPVLRIVGRRRVRRLGELVGDPPADLADGVWPE